ncbi:hypothetical protein W97_01383 [Coniosporium apollinis CBS 100218]|uniref:Endonuclease/exonuclease/phosphatase domain-containing protein n=1 Tax=Coniosporium apollinis (strain CBS 100218) TaxID=1168221 RepID=R7YK40_CONA1|nr:uncharacterized protein W97_01383 [Coniosporium apollinis CBS 100218]EON62164.1 hypothetical protein W97_01383 [Coniosporium apollinis CBS 100218]
MFPTTFWSFFQVALLCLSLLCLVTARPPDESTAPTKPSTIQLRSEVVKTILPPRKSGRGRTGNPSATSFVELQLNLCNSGFAGCYKDGKSIPEGSARIYNAGPNLVTVNEVCFSDVTKHLQPALAEAWPDDYTYSVFMPALYKGNDTAYRCRGFKDFYGNAVIGRVAAANWKGVTAYGGRYATQAAASNEARTFACAEAEGDHFACVTHLAATPPETALAQCKALMFDAVPYLKAVGGATGKTVVGGDFNLKYDKGSSTNVQLCVPNGYTRKGDGDVQHIIAMNSLVFQDTDQGGLTYSDHPWFSADFTAR